MSLELLLGVSLLYAALLFSIAWLGDRRPTVGARPWTFSLALGVYCSSWTFYGAVGRASSSGMDFSAIYIGPILMFVFGLPLLQRLVAVTKRNSLTSIADFFGARYGNNQRLASLVAVMLTFAVLPYLALQLQAISLAIQTIGGAGTDAGRAVLLADILLIVFTMLFGTRHLTSLESHRGLLRAIAFESIVKLVAFTTVSVFVVFTVFAGDIPEVTQRSAQTLTQWAASADPLNFVVQCGLSALAIICLPRQFHVMCVENTSPSELRRARTVFPIYLGLFTVLVLPISLAGPPVFGSTGPSPDTYVLGLPLALDAPAITALAFIGGISAASAMVVMTALALSTMLSNEVLMPLGLRTRWTRLAGPALQARVLWTRRLCIIALLLGALAVHAGLIAAGPLADTGLLAFAAVAQLAPGLIGGLFWTRGNRHGTLAGLLAGFALWAVFLLLPFIGHQEPQAGFYRGVLVALGCNVLLYVVVSGLTSQTLRERVHVARFLGLDHQEPEPPKGRVAVGDLSLLLERFYPPDRVQAFIADFAREHDCPLPKAPDEASAAFREFVSRRLASVVGSASAAALMAAATSPAAASEALQFIEQSSRVASFNRELLQSTLDHLSAGVSVVDRDLRLVAWNRAYIDLFRYPAGHVRTGRPIADLIRYNANRGMLGPGEPEALIQRRVDHLRAAHSYTHERALPDGTVIQIRGNPLPNGGFVTTYTDVTDYKRVEGSLRALAATLEERVAERTLELQSASAEAERANQSKTRFVAAAVHDLMQPLNAARLFASAIEDATRHGPAHEQTQRLEQSLASMESILDSLLDISRLESGVLKTRIRDVGLAELLRGLGEEFEPLAKSRGLRLRVAVAHGSLRTDETLLRRILQNFISNAIRYTERGGVLLGCRRRGDQVRIEVWDSGLGIAPEQQREIYQEFRRLSATDQLGTRGAGLGLAIVDRIADLLGHPIGLRSWPGRGSVFSVTVPAGSTTPPPRRRPVSSVGERPLAGTEVWCVDDEPAALDALRAVLERWGCKVRGFQTASQTEQAAADAPAPGALLIDQHLPDDDGLRLQARLRQHWGEVPVIMISADRTREVVESARAQGLAHLPKPVRPAALRALLTRTIRTSH